MGYTPVELRHVRVARRPFGYHRASVEKVMSDVADSFETVWRDRGDLAEKVEQLQQQLHDLKSREQVLTDTLVAAERASQEIKDRAKREAELILAEAHGEARSIMRAAQSDRERLVAEAQRVEALLRSALGLVVETTAPAVPEPASEPPRAELPQSVSMSTPEPPQRHEPGGSTALPSAARAETTTVGESSSGGTGSERLDEQPEWPPIREVAQHGGDFDWDE